MRYAAVFFSLSLTVYAGPIYNATPLSAQPLGFVTGLSDNGWISGVRFGSIAYTYNLNDPASYLLYPTFTNGGAYNNVTNTGQVIGSSVTNLISHGWIGQNGTWTELPGPSGGAQLSDISANGSIVVGQATPSPGGTPQGAIWNNGVMTPVPGTNGLIAVSRSGNAVVGEAPAAPFAQIFLRFNGIDSLIDPGGHDVDALGVNDLGIWIGGRWDLVQGQTTTNIVVGDSTGFQIIGNPAGFRALGVRGGINNAGQVIYNTVPTAFNSGAVDPYLWDAVNGSRSLSSLAGIALQQVMAINNNGQIVALGQDLNYYLLDPISPVPEPGTWALMLAGLAAVAARRRR